MSTLTYDFKQFARYFPSMPLRWIALHYAKRHLKSHRDIPPDMAFMLTYVLWADRKYSDSQPRVPAGSPAGGQWTSGDGGGGGSTALFGLQTIASNINAFGRLSAELPRTDFLSGLTSGRWCVYQFDTFSSIVEGRRIFRAQLGHRGQPSFTVRYSMIIFPED